MTDPDELHRLAGREYHSGNFEQAARFLERAVESAPARADLWVDLGPIYRRLGRSADAERCYRRALELQPGRADALQNLGNVLRDAQRLEEAEQCYRQALAARPDAAELCQNLGNLLNDRGRMEEAERYLRQAVALGPQRAEAHCDLAHVLYNRGRYAEAVAAYQQGLALQPRIGAGHNGLGRTLAAMGRLQEAEICYRRALALAPASLDALNSLGNVLQELGRLGEAESAYREVLRQQPDTAAAHANLAKLLMALGRLDEAVASNRRALALQPDFANAHSNLIFTLDLMASTDVRVQQEERRRWYEQHGRVHAAGIKPHDNAPDPERKLRVGYVSADFRQHSAYNAFAPVLRSHDAASFEVVCYSGVRNEDQLTVRLREAVGEWHAAFGLSDDELAQQIRRDRIDILVDLSGHSAGHRLLVFARKPAPVQVTAWGHATGTGLGTMDYFLADPIVVSADERREFAEAVIDLPCVLCYEAPPYLPDVAPLPFRHGNPFTFGCVNRLEKVTDRIIAVWGRILAAAPDARLLMKDKVLDDAGLREQLLQRLERLGGIARRRVQLFGRSIHPEHLKIFQRVDVGLDPYPQGGGVSSAEALCMGVPVVTLRGATIPSRVTASVLHQIGLAQWAAGTEDEYVRIALDAMRDPDELGTLRRGLRQRVLQSRFGDTKKYTRAVEQAYREMWHRWCAAKK